MNNVRVKTTRVNDKLSYHHVRTDNKVVTYRVGQSGLEYIQEQTFPTNAAARRFLRDN